MTRADGPVHGLKNPTARRRARLASTAPCRAHLAPTARRRARLAALGLCALFAAGAGVALGCGWTFDNSVRFNWMSERERQRLPPLPYRLSGKDAPAAKNSVEEDYEAAGREAAATDALWNRAAQAVDRGDLRAAVPLLREFAARAEDNDARVNTAADQLDAISALDAGSTHEAVRAYLGARRAFDLLPLPSDSGHKDGRSQASAAVAPVTTPPASGADAPVGSPQDSCAAPRPPSELLAERLREPNGDPRLADNFAYLRAALLYREGKASEAASAFREFASRHPRSEKREAALFMAARAALAASRASLGPGATATSEDACPDCRDDAWRAARDGFTRLLDEYPRGRLAGESRGWLAYLSWRVGDRAAALAEYYRMLADEDDAGANTEALKSLRLARGRAEESDMERVERALEDEPRAALAYAYHDIYNYTQSYYFNVPELDSDASSADHYCNDDWCRDRERARAEAATGRAEHTGLSRVARFASRMIERHAGARVGGAFVVRVAQANLEMGELDAAHSLARRALASGVTGEARAGALWAKGVAEYRRRDLDDSRRTLAQLAAEFPGGDLETPARRLRAIASEAAGDLEAALEEYFAISYEADAAYFTDVLMTPEQLASFVARHPAHARTNELLYSLGVRYLRAGRYAEARATLRRVRTTVADLEDLYDRYRDYSAERDHPKEVFLRDFFGYDYEESDAGADAHRRSFVSAAWVMLDLQTAEDLERLSAAAERAPDREAKAEALYQLASYLYEGSDLKFYNPAAWRGWRANLLASLDESDYRAPGEAEAVWRHAREHESVARALDIYLDIVRQYPDTRAAPDALYTAILCHQRLENFNGYWRDAYALGLHAGERVVTYADLRREYPRYRLPLHGKWEPSTRTVEGSPAWPAPPAPKKLTGTERVRLRVRRAEALAVKGWALAGEVAGGRARRWSLALLCALAACAAWRATRRSRAALYELLRRAAARRVPRPNVLPRPSSSYAAHEPYTTAARLRSAAGRLGGTLFEILLDARARAALALNLFTHGLLTVLLWALAWALRS